MDQPREKTITFLRKLAQAEAACTRCPLYRDATQAVPGEGPARATLMLVGEQPGDKEDIAGKPFVGPSGAFSIRRYRTPALSGRKSSLRGLTGKTVTIKKIRGQALSLADGTTLFVTVHPSSLLRIEDQNDKQKAYRQFVADLKKAAAEKSP